MNDAKVKTGPPTDTPPRSHDRRPFIAGALLLCAAAIVAYLPAITGGFIWDDPDYVINNLNLRSLDGLRMTWLEPKSLPQYYPLVHTTFWVEYQLWGLHPLGYHLVNVILHVTSALLLWRILRRLEVPGAYLAAVIFALHPVHVESVAWITERKNVLSLFFYLAAAYAYLFKSGVGLDRDAHPGLRWGGYVGAMLLFVCALLSKTVTFSLPAALAVVIWWKRGRLAWRDIVPLLPFVAVGGLLAWNTARLEVHHVGADPGKVPELRLNFGQRFLIAGRVIWFYIGKLLVPVNLIFIYPRWDVRTDVWWQWLFPIGVIVAVALLAVFVRRIGRGPLAAFLLFCGTLFPALGFFNVYPMRFSYVADHFVYHASLGIIVLVAALVWRAIPKDRDALRAAIICIVAAPLAVLTFRQSRLYEDAETLWRATLERNQTSWMVWTNLGNALVARERYDEAEHAYNQALALAEWLHDTHVNVAMMHGLRGRYEQAIDQFNEALRLNPDFAPAYYGRGQVYARLGQMDEAERDFRKALEIAPEYPEANFRLAAILESRGDLADAIDHYRAAVTAQPNFAEARYNLGNTLIAAARTGELSQEEELRLLDEAIHNLRWATRARPDYAEAWTNLGAAQLLAGRASDAAESFGRALQINPTLEPARRGLQAAQSLK